MLKPILSKSHGLATVIATNVDARANLLSISNASVQRHEMRYRKLRHSNCWRHQWTCSEHWNVVAGETYGYYTSLISNDKIIETMVTATKVSVVLPPALFTQLLSPAGARARRTRSRST